MFSKLKIQLKTLTLLSLSYSNQSFSIKKMLANIYELKQQKKHIKSVKNIISLSIVEDYVT